MRPAARLKGGCGCAFKNVGSEEKSMVRGYLVSGAGDSSERAPPHRQQQQQGTE